MRASVMVMDGGDGVGGGCGDAGCGAADEVDDAPWCDCDGGDGKHIRWCSARLFICMIIPVLDKHPRQLGSGGLQQGECRLDRLSGCCRQRMRWGQQDWRAAAISCIVSST